MKAGSGDAMDRGPGQYFNHPICLACFERKHPARVPHRLTEPESERCCFCGELTLDGICVRAHEDEAPRCECGD